jgi:hypothetical protein
VWFALLVPGFDRHTGEPPDDLRDCSRRDITGSADGRDTPTPARPRTADDLTFGTADDGALLVWARLLDYPDGTALGPVVLARWVAQGLEIRGVGGLRAPARRARLHLESLPGDLPLLIAEGEACPVDPACPTCPSDQVACPREAVLLPLVDQRFLTADIIEGEHAPRPAVVRLDERHDLPRADGRTRRVEVRRRIDLRGRTPALHAAIRIRDCAPGLPCDEHLTLVDARPLTLSGLTFVTVDDPVKTLLARQAAQSASEDGGESPDDGRNEEH